MLVGRQRPMLAFPTAALAEVFAWRFLTRQCAQVQQMPNSLESFIVEMVQRLDPDALQKFLWLDLPKGKFGRAITNLSATGRSLPV